MLPCGGYLISIAYCLFFSFVVNLQIFEFCKKLFLNLCVAQAVQGKKRKSVITVIYEPVLKF